MKMYTDYSRAWARKVHKQLGGYLCRSGVKDKWIVVDDPWRVTGFRDSDAYGADLVNLTKSEWEDAQWDEMKLPNYLPAGLEVSDEPT